MRELSVKNPYWIAKFGGTSLANYTAMLRCATILSQAPKVRVVVVSAPAGITNLLVKLSQTNLSSLEQHAVFQELKNKYLEVMSTFPETIRNALQDEVEGMLLEIAQLAKKLIQAFRQSYLDEILAYGERLSTKLFSCLLTQNNTPVKYLDARCLIKTNDHFGKAEVLIDETHAAVTKLLLPECEHQLVVTEGFIGSTLQGETTTLGRGGSDYSAALLAEAMNAEVLQIWTDVSGIYTVDPRLVPQAKPIENLSFTEAAELATFGAKVLHPSTLWPAIRKNIPVYVGSSLQSQTLGTWIHADQKEVPLLRAIALRRQQSLLTITSLDMLQAHGFLAKIFNILAKYKISVDLVTTSEISVALTLNNADVLNEAVLIELQNLGNVSLKIDKDLSLIALVGNALHLTSGIGGQVFSEISQFNIRLVCHGASSHNLCFLVHESDDKEIIRLLHAKFFENTAAAHFFDVKAILNKRSEEWYAPNQWEIPLTSAINEKNHFSVGGCDVVDLVRQFDTPLYILDEQHIRQACRELMDAIKHYPSHAKVLYASKALSTSAIATIMHEEGLGMDVMSEGELLIALNANIPADLIYFHGNNKSVSELRLGLLNNCRIVVDNWQELALLNHLTAELSLTANILIRFTPNINSFTHQHIRTGHVDSKFGFNYDEIDAVIDYIKQNKSLRCYGLHAHIGSQIADVDSYAELAIITAKLANAIYLKHQLYLEEINLGGGLAVNYGAGNDIPSIKRWLSVLMEAFIAHYDCSQIKLPTLIVEPGRTVIATAGITAYRTGSQKTIKTGKKYIAVDGGMSDNPRPITYGAKHSVFVGNQVQSEEREKVTIVGKHCESGDVLFKDVIVPTIVPGDILIVAGTGAYNYSQSSNYNKIPRPAVVLVANEKATIIVKRETNQELLKKDVQWEGKKSAS